MFSPAFVCLYVCLCVRVLKNECMDLDEMLRVDRCRDMDELINFWARSRSYSGCRIRIAFSHSICTATRNIIYYVGKIRIGRSSQQRRVVLRRRNTVVGGKCALPSALLVINYYWCECFSLLVVQTSNDYWTQRCNVVVRRCRAGKPNNYRVAQKSKPLLVYEQVLIKYANKANFGWIWVSRKPS